MHPKTLKALQESIAHHQRFVDGKSAPTENVSSLKCALCARFPVACKNFHENEECPVAIATGKIQCRGTPWYGYKKVIEKSSAPYAGSDDIRQVSLPNGKQIHFNLWELLAGYLRDGGDAKVIKWFVFIKETTAWEKAAKREVAFLKSLLPRAQSKKDLAKQT
jgi:hypothetical protein